MLEDRQTCSSHCTISMISAFFYTSAAGHLSVFIIVLANLPLLPHISPPRSRDPLPLGPAKLEVSIWACGVQGRVIYRGT